MLSPDHGTGFHLNAQKNHVALYVEDAKRVGADADWLRGIDYGKGCLRFKKSLLLEDTGIDRFIRKAVTVWKSGQGMSC